KPWPASASWPQRRCRRASRWHTLVVGALQPLELGVAPADQPLGDIQVAVLVGREAVRALDLAGGERGWTTELACRILRVRPARTVTDRLVGAEIADQSV